MKMLFNNVYMNEGTPIFDSLFIMTQYSDFISRVVEYEFEMEDAPALGTKAYDNYKNKVISNVRELFVNYDLPDPSLLRYLNRTGILMFTKYFIGIQKVIVGTALENPVSSALFLLSQLNINNIDDIFEQNILNKDLSNLVYGPYNNALNILIPTYL